MKRIRLSLIVIAAAFGLEAAAAAGDSAVWTNVTKKTASWLVAGNWTDGSGNPLAAAPAGGENITIVDVPELPAHNSYIADANILGEQTINYETSASVFSLVMGDVTGDRLHTLGLGYDGSSQNHIHYNQSVTVGNPTGFLGFWQFGGMELSVTTPASALLTPVFHNFSAKHNPVVIGSDAEGTTVIDTLYDGGAITKSGDGTLRVKATSGEQMVVYQRSGKLVLDGAADGALADILDRSALHLDASVDGSLEKELADDGFVSVRKWKDVRGEEGRYYFIENLLPRTAGHEVKKTNPPFLSDDAKSPTGLTLVDFGARSAYGLAEFPERGRTNCMMKLGKDGTDSVRLTGVREAFYAVSSPKGANAVQILGDSGTIHYMCTDSTSLFNATYSDPAVRHGDIIFNNSKHAFNGFAAQELTDLYTLGVGVGRDTAVSYLGTRQYYANATGGSRMGEIILFTNDLTRAERLMVCRYLDAKWRTGDVANNDLTALCSTSSSPTVEVAEAGKTARIGTVSITTSTKVLNKTGAGTLVVGRMTEGTTVNVQGGKVEFSGVKADDTAVAANPYVHLDAADIGAGDVEVVDDQSYVNYWNDTNYGAERRAVAAAIDVAGAARPTLIDSPIVGRRVVDFGAFKKDGSGAWMKLCNWNDTSSHQAHAGFIVMRTKATSKSCPHFG